MNTTRLLSTLVAAAALTGGIGFAYAQTAMDSTQTPASTSSNSTPMTTPASSTPANPPMDSGSTMPAATGERAPKADRG